MATPTNMEIHNLLSHPVGPEYQLVVGEGRLLVLWQSSIFVTRSSRPIGTYLLRDDIHLSTPQPHQSEAPITNPNPLATTPVPPTAGVKLSLSIVSPRKAQPKLYKLNAFDSTKSNLVTYSIKESEKESRTSHDTSSDGAPQQSAADVSGKAPAFGEDNSFLSSTSGKEGLKRRKPKTNIVKNTSSFISRVIQHDAMSKRIQEHSPEGLFMFANINRAFQWLDLSSTTFSKVLSSRCCSLFMLMT